MKSLKERLPVVEKHVNGGKIVIMIIGLGSVGTYLLDYIISRNDPKIQVVVVGRDHDKIEKNVNIVKIAGVIRQLNKSQIVIESGIDLNIIESVDRKSVV